MVASCLRRIAGQWDHAPFPVGRVHRRCRHPWRCADLGWGTAVRAGGDVVVGAPYGDYVTPADFAALLGINPFPVGANEPWVFAAPRDKSPAFAITFTDDGLQLSTDVSMEVGYSVWS